MNDSTTLLVGGGGFLAIIGIILAVLGALRTKPAPAPSPVEKKEEDVAQKKIDDAKVVEEKDIQQAKDDHDKAVADVIAKEEKQADKVDDGKAVNDFLKDIGDKVKS